MNCQQGDLAVVVKSGCGNEGKIVRCIKLLPPGQRGNAWRDGPAWETDNNTIRWRTLEGLNGVSNEVYDSILRPIRDTPGEDETLTWAPKKEPVPA